MGTWLVRLQGFSDATGNVLLSDDGAVDITQPDTGTARLAVFDDASAFVYLDGASSPVGVSGLPAGFTPDDAFTLHHLTQASTSQDSLELAIDGLFDQTFLGPFGNDFPNYADLSLTGMTLAKFTALLGSDVLLSFIVGTDPISGCGEQSNLVYDALFTCNLNGAYTTVVPPVPTLTGIAPPSGPVAGGTTVTIAGTGFLAVTGVTVGGVTVAFTLVSPTRLTFVTPAHAAGPVTVTLGGVSLSTVFTYAVTGTKLPPIPRLR